MGELVRAWREVEADTPTLVVNDEHTSLPHKSNRLFQAWGNDDSKDNSLCFDSRSAAVERCGTT